MRHFNKSLVAAVLGLFSLLGSSRRRLLWSRPGYTVTSNGDTAASGRDRRVGPVPRASSTCVEVAGMQATLRRATVTR